MSRAAQSSERIEQLVFEPVAGRQLELTRASVPEREAADLNRRYGLVKHIAGNSTPRLATAGNIYYAVHEPGHDNDQRTAVLIFRQSVPGGGRYTSKAHVLIGPAAVMTPESAVAMLEAWPWQLDGWDPARIQPLEPIRPHEYSSAVERVRATGSWPTVAGLGVRDRQQIDRLLIALAQAGGSGLSVKVHPAQRAALVHGVMDELGAVALSRGFSMDEMEYKSPDLPALVFFTQEAGAAVRSTRAAIDLDQVWRDETGLLDEAAMKVVEALKRGGADAVRAVLRDGFPRKENPSLANCLTAWANQQQVYVISVPGATSAPPIDLTVPPPITVRDDTIAPPAQQSSPTDTTSLPVTIESVEDGVASGDSAGTVQPDVIAQPLQLEEDFAVAVEAPPDALLIAQEVWSEYLRYHRRHPSPAEPAGPSASLLNKELTTDTYMVMAWHMIDSRVRQYPEIVGGSDPWPAQDLVEFVAHCIARPVATATYVSLKGEVKQDVGLPPSERRKDQGRQQTDDVLQGGSAPTEVTETSETPPPNVPDRPNDRNVVDSYTNDSSADAIGMGFALVLVLALAFAALGLALGLMR